MRPVDSVLMEIDQEAQTTKKILDQLPEDKLGWKPHPKSYSLGHLALHIATSPPKVAAAAVPDNFERPNLTQAEPKSRKEILDAFSQGLEATKATLSKMDDIKRMSTWNLSMNGKVVMPVARMGFLRAILLNHIYHHRGNSPCACDCWTYRCLQFTVQASTKIHLRNAAQCRPLD